MKKMHSFIIMMLLGYVGFSQDGITVCHTSSTEKFALFASSNEFNAKHPAPMPYHHVSEVGKMITFKTADGQDAYAYLLQATEKTNNWIFVFQEWWGLNDYIKREAEKIYNDLGNVNVLALDMYDGKLATDAQTAGRYMNEFKQERGNSIVKGALTYAGKHATIATIGWCFGGGQSLQAALTLGKHAVACVMYYGMPEENIDRLKTLNCAILNIWPTQDKWITKELMDTFEINMIATGKKIIIKPYNADHAFANPSNSRFNKELADDAYQHTITFFKEKLN